MSHDTLIHRGVRGVVRPLASVGVTPNQITTGRLLTGLAGALIYALDFAYAGLWGSALVLLSIGLDRLDGELARTTGTTSEFGHRYDLYSDATVNAAIFLGAGIGMREHGWWVPALGVLAALGVIIALALIVRVERLHGPRAGEVARGGRIDPDDAMLLAPVAVLFGAQLQLVAVAGVAAPLAAAALFWHLKTRFTGADGSKPRDA